MTTALRIPFSRQSARKLLIILILIDIVLVAVYLIHHSSYEIPRQLHKVFIGTLQLYKETSIPSWHLSMQFFMIGALFLLHKNWPKYGNMNNSTFLLVVGIGFMVLSMDSLAQFSESGLQLLGYKTDRENRWFVDFPGLWIAGCTIVLLALFTIGRSGLRSMFNEYSEATRIMLLVLGSYIVFRMLLTIVDILYLHGTGESFSRHLAFTFKVFLDMVCSSVFLYATLLCVIRDSD